MSKFIMTKDNEIAKKLKLMGFIQVPSNNNLIVFMNNNNIKLNFNDIDKSKICYSNILCI